MGTFLVGAVLAVVVTSVVIVMVRAKKQGKSGCGCGCENCPSRCDKEK